MTKPVSAPKRPASATHATTGLVGFVCMLGAMAALYHNQAVIPQIQAILIVGFVAISMMAVDIIFFQVHKRASTGLHWGTANVDFSRCAIKILGLFTTLALCAGVFYLLPEYHKNFYNPAWHIAKTFLPLMLPLFIVYFIIIDKVMKDPEDGYYQTGLLALGQWKKADGKILRLHARSWGIKMFFIPLMLVFLSNNMENLHGTLSSGWLGHPITLGTMLFWFAFTTDLVFALCGYIFAFRLIDTQERSSEPSLLGWIVAFACYPPFNDFLHDSYLQYGSENAWQSIFAPHFPFMILWGVMILSLYGIYTWATVVFGNRFSNLTHRGIITSGPYRFTKHPAYIAKNLSWWLGCMPFLAMGDIGDCIRGSIMLLMMNGFYFMRAYTEERHLARDPVYREYQEWILAHGLFRWMPFKLCPKPLA